MCTVKRRCLWGSVVKRFNRFLQTNFTNSVTDVRTVKLCRLPPDQYFCVRRNISSGMTPSTSAVYTSSRRMQYLFGRGQFVVKNLIRNSITRCSLLLPQSRIWYSNTSSLAARSLFHLLLSRSMVRSYAWSNGATFAVSYVICNNTCCDFIHVHN